MPPAPIRDAIWYGPTRWPSKLSTTMASASSTAGVSRKLFACVSSASSDFTSSCSASLPPHASARYAARRSNGNARASANTSFRRGQWSGGSVKCSGFYRPAGGTVVRVQGNITGLRGAVEEAMGARRRNPGLG